MQFLNEYIEETDNSDDKLHCVDLYKIFYKMNIPNEKVPSDREFVKNLRKYKFVEESIRIGKTVKRGIKKHKFIHKK